MMASIKWLVPVVAIAVPLAAFAQGNDEAYCQALSAKYQTFVNNMGGHSNDRGALDAQVAISQCNQGNAAAAIPVLERELNNNKIALPNRS